jgi:tetratricopeptide (TPR) repeat protein
MHIALALLLTVPPILVSGQETDSEVGRHFLTARQAQSSGDLDVAAREYLAVLRLQPAFAEVRVNLGLVYYLQARYDQSIQELEKALTTKPGLRGANLFLGIAYVKLGRSRQAVACLKRAVEQEPANKQAIVWLGSALWDAGRESEAIAELRDAEKAFPADPDILFLLGQAYRTAANEEMQHVLAEVGTSLYHQAYGDIYMDQQAWKQALGHYQRALEKDPRWAAAHLGLGEVHLQQANLELARSEFLKVPATGSDSVIATAHLAEIALLQGQPDDALRLLNEAIQKEPDTAAGALGLPPLPFAGNAVSSDDMKTRYRQSAASLQKIGPSHAHTLALAVIDLRLGLNKESAAEWQNYRSMVRFPVPAGNDYERAIHEFNQHDFAAARSHVVSFLATHPHHSQAQYLLARTSRCLGLSVLANMLSAAPDSPRTHQLMAQTLAGRAENEKALAEYRQLENAEINAPAARGVHFAIGELLWKMNQTDAAMGEFQQELRLNPGYAEASAAAGTILVSAHQADRAVPYLEKALQLKPELLSAHQELGKALYQRREFAQALAELRRALPDDPDGNLHYLLGNVYKQLGREADAAASFAESRRIKAERLDAINSANNAAINAATTSDKAAR